VAGVAAAAGARGRGLAVHFDDDPETYLAKLRPRQMVSLSCPDCPAVIIGQGEAHARDLLAIHREGTCQGGEEVSGDADSDPAPADPPADVPRLTPPARMYHG